MKIAIVTAIWQRPEVWDMFKQGVRRLRNQYEDVEVEVCVAGSEGYRSQNRCKENWIHYVEMPNNPLGRKMNAASLLSKETNADYYLLMGSDDIICNNLFDLYLDYMEQGIDYIYLMDGFFFDTTTKKSLYWAGYRQDHNKGDSLGAGRMLSKKMMEKMDYQCWYDVKMSGLLDQAMNEKLEGFEYTKQEIWLRDNNCMLLDIKSSTNMTKFAKWDNTEFIDTKRLLDFLPTYEFNKIYNG
jgi:hypothetical protein